MYLNWNWNPCFRKWTPEIGISELKWEIQQNPNNKGWITNTSLTIRRFMHICCDAMITYFLILPLWIWRANIFYFFCTAANKQKPNSLETITTNKIISCCFATPSSKTTHRNAKRKTRNRKKYSSVFTIILKCVVCVRLIKNIHFPLFAYWNH